MSTETPSQAPTKPQTSQAARQHSVEMVPTASASIGVGLAHAMEGWRNGCEETGVQLTNLKIIFMTDQKSTPLLWLAVIVLTIMSFNLSGKLKALENSVDEANASAEEAYSIAQDAQYQAEEANGTAEDATSIAEDAASRVDDACSILDYNC